MTDNRLPLTILGGWLGAGKTTWLRHHLQNGLPAEVIVNEAAGVAVDDALLSAATGLTVLGGGCACCQAREALLAVLRRLADRRSAGAPMTQVILETSGLADPGAILSALNDDPLVARHVRLQEVVVLVDAVNGPAELATGALAIRQIRAANRLILTKTDAAPPGMVARLAATLVHLNPAAEISAAVAGQPVALPAAPPATLPADLLPLADRLRPVSAATLNLPAGADWPALALWLSALLYAHGDRLLRIKGVVLTPAGRLLLQTVRRHVQPPEILPQGLGQDNLLAVIGENPDAAGLQASLARFLA